MSFYSWRAGAAGPEPRLVKGRLGCCMVVLTPDLEKFAGGAISRMSLLTSGRQSCRTLMKHHRRKDSLGVADEFKLAVQVLDEKLVRGLRKQLELRVAGDLRGQVAAFESHLISFAVFHHVGANILLQ